MAFHKLKKYMSSSATKIKLPENATKNGIAGELPPIENPLQAERDISKINNKKRLKI